MRGFLFSLILFPIFLFSDQETGDGLSGSDVPFEPWLTGPLIAPAAATVDPGHPSIMVTFTALNTYGDYDSNWKFQNDADIWTLSYFLDFQLSFTKRIGIELFASADTCLDKGCSSTHLDDTILLLGYQVSNDIKGSWVPDCKFLIQGIFPTGRYDRFNTPLQIFAVTGQGAYFIGPGLAFQKLFYLPRHFLMVHWAIGYNFPTRASVKDFNVYGGGIGTKGTIRPGQLLNGNISFEYTLNKNWALAIDFFVTFQLPTSRFKGERGFTLDGEVADVGLPSSTQVSITPSIEYSNSPQLGWLFGAWLTIAGQNAEAFAGGFLAFSYVF